MTRRVVALGTLLFVCASLISCSPLDDEPTDQDFIDDGLYLQIKPRLAEPGEQLTFFVQGEPPANLRVSRFVDLLTSDGEPLYRLDAVSTGPQLSSSIAYPLPPSYEAPATSAKLAERQRVSLPDDLPPGQYRLEGKIEAANSSRDLSGSPGRDLVVVADSDGKSCEDVPACSDAND